MVRSRSVELAQLWRERLERQAQAKCSVAEFCRREGVSQPAFYHWRKRLQSGPRWRILKLRISTEIGRRSRCRSLFDGAGVFQFALQSPDSARCLDALG